MRIRYGASAGQCPRVRPTEERGDVLIGLADCFGRPATSSDANGTGSPGAHALTDPAAVAAAPVGATEAVRSIFGSMWLRAIRELGARREVEVSALRELLLSGHGIEGRRPSSVLRRSVRTSRSRFRVAMLR
jgi:hypothetical protein